MSQQDFPPLKNDRFLRACRGEEVDRAPVWIMRQAGRYLPEFREFRTKHEFFEICQTPEFACEVTLQPLRRFDLDASIIFSDILVIPQSMGLKVEMRPGVGPVLPDPLKTPDDMKRLIYPDASKDLRYVGDAITLTRQKLEGKVPLIGFAGAPWTLMGYMIEGGGSSTMARARLWLYKYPEESHQLLDRITDILVEYVAMQVACGAQAVQIFESHANFLNDELFEEYSLKYLKKLSVKVKELLTNTWKVPTVPMIAFAKGATMNSLEKLAKTGCYDVLGLDWSVDPVEARKRFGANVTLQGNMDPCALFATEKEVEERGKKMVEIFGKTRYIANLGHGILPDAPIPSVEAFIKGVHSV